VTGGAAKPRLLIITPSFFGYERDIASEFARQGFNVTLLDERPSNTALVRAVLRVRRSLIRHRVERYYQRMLVELGDTELDLVLVIKGEVVPRWFLEELRARSPSARLIFYSYDALANAGNALAMLDLFDDRVSFDRDDVAAYAGFRYVPLFYTPEYAPRPGEGDDPRRHQLCFIGTLHSDRYPFVKRLMAGASTSYQFFYVQARWYFFLVKYVTREHRHVPWSDASFTKLSRSEIAGVFRESLAVLDMQRPGQSGLTMRTFEVLASAAILVTTNAAITREPFYDPGRIVVASPLMTTSEAHSLGERVRAMQPPAKPPPGFSRYSLRSWVRAVADPPASPDSRG
jgi:hypothetical protein